MTGKQSRKVPGHMSVVQPMRPCLRRRAWVPVEQFTLMRGGSHHNIPNLHNVPSFFFEQTCTPVPPRRYSSQYSYALVSCCNENAECPATCAECNSCDPAFPELGCQSNNALSCTGDPNAEVAQLPACLKCLGGSCVPFNDAPCGGGGGFCHDGYCSMWPLV